jgi:hypothetical protein
VHRRLIQAVASRPEGASRAERVANAASALCAWFFDEPDNIDVRVFYVVACDELGEVAQWNRAVIDQAAVICRARSVVGDELAAVAERLLDALRTSDLCTWQPTGSAGTS